MAESDQVCNGDHQTYLLSKLWDLVCASTVARWCLLCATITVCDDRPAYTRTSGTVVCAWVSNGSYSTRSASSGRGYHGYSLVADDVIHGPTAPAQVHNTPMRVPVVARNTANPAHISQENGSSDFPQPPVQGVQSSQHTQVSDSPSSDRQLTAFTLHPLRVHQISTEIIQTAETRGQQVPEGEYDIFRHLAVRSSLGPFHSSADNADDFLQEIRSLISTDDVRKDKMTWEMQPSLKAALKYCSKIAQGVETSNDIRIPLLWSSLIYTDNFRNWSLSSSLLRTCLAKNTTSWRSILFRQLWVRPQGLRQSQPVFSIFAESASHRRTHEESCNLEFSHRLIGGIYLGAPLKESRDKVVQEQVRILHKSSIKAVSSAVASAANL